MNTPGVYIQEITTFPPSVVPVETAIPAFIGITRVTVDSDGNSLINVPTRITSVLEYEQIFGSSNSQAFSVDVEQDFTEIPVQLIETRVTLAAAPPTEAAPPDRMHYAVQMFYANGGGPCYIVSATATNFIDALDALEEVDEPTIIASPDAVDEANYDAFYEAAMMQCNKLQDRVTVIDVLDAQPGGNVAPADIDNNFRTPMDGDISTLKYGMAYYPYLITSIPFITDDSVITVASHTVTVYDSTGADVTLTTPQPVPAAIAGGTMLDDAVVDIPVNFNSVYTSIKAFLPQYTVTLPPSTSIAGIYAKVDNDRGVWKAPANVGVMNINGPALNVTNDFQDLLNVDAGSGKSVNAIRTFTGRGTMVWGARTLAGNDNEWRYVPVRRFFNFAEESIKKATGRFVFEPNDKNTWTMVKTMIENFLLVQWRAGALAGEKPEHAFYVKVGLNQTMTADDILNGFMNVEIGMAVVRPAEFIILKFSHKMQES